jgi:hypothetical protein
METSGPIEERLTTVERAVKAAEAEAAGDYADKLTAWGLGD